MNSGPANTSRLTNTLKMAAEMKCPRQRAIASRSSAPPDNLLHRVSALRSSIDPVWRAK